MRQKIAFFLILTVVTLAVVTAVRADPPAVSPAPTSQPDGVATADKRVEAAQSALMQARAAAVRDYQNRPEFQKAVKDAQGAFAAFNDKRNALIGEVEKDPRIAASKKQANDTETAINEACKPTSTATPEQIETLFRQKADFNRDWQTMENEAMDQQGLAPLRKTWKEASDALAGLMDREADEVEKADAVKAAAAALQAAQAEANVAAHAPAGDVDPRWMIIFGDIRTPGSIAGCTIQKCKPRRRNRSIVVRLEARKTTAIR